MIRGKKRQVKYKIKGPFFIEGIPNQAVFLLVISGGRYQAGKRVQYRKPDYFLINGVKNNGNWELPIPEEDLIYFAWQRWEIEVCHRDMKSGFGLGDKQCWSPKSSVQTVQWNAWVYGVLKWFGYKNREKLKEPAMVGKWYGKRRRWTVQMLLQCYRIAFWCWGDEIIKDFLAEDKGIGGIAGKNTGILARIWHSALGVYRV